MYKSCWNTVCRLTKREEQRVQHLPHLLSPFNHLPFESYKAISHIKNLTMLSTMLSLTFLEYQRSTHKKTTKPRRLQWTTVLIKVAAQHNQKHPHLHRQMATISAVSCRRRQCGPSSGQRSGQQYVTIFPFSGYTTNSTSSTSSRMPSNYIHCWPSAPACRWPLPRLSRRRGV